MARRVMHLGLVPSSRPHLLSGMHRDSSLVLAREGGGRPEGLTILRPHAIAPKSASRHRSKRQERRDVASWETGG